MAMGDECLDEHPDLGQSIVRWVQFSCAAAAADVNKDDQIGKLPRRNEKKIATFAYSSLAFGGAYHVVSAADL
jgi:hypothetical protein